jgi:hypothetical protein
VLGASGIFMRKQALCLFYGKQNLFFNFQGREINKNTTSSFFHSLSFSLFYFLI